VGWSRIRYLSTISIRGPYASNDEIGGSIPPLRFEVAARALEEPRRRQEDHEGTAVARGCATLRGADLAPLGHRG
jgi:hypothetical protein